MNALGLATRERFGTGERLGTRELILGHLNRKKRDGSLSNFRVGGKSRGRYKWGVVIRGGALLFAPPQLRYV